MNKASKEADRAFKEARTSSKGVRRGGERRRRGNRGEGGGGGGGGGSPSPTAARCSGWVFLRERRGLLGVGSFFL